MRGRGNAGYGLPLPAYASRETLNTTNHAAARTAMMADRGPDGRRPRAMLSERELRFFSPALAIDPRSRRVLRIVGGGLTARPALEMTAVTSKEVAPAGGPAAQTGRAFGRDPARLADCNPARAVGTMSARRAPQPAAVGPFQAVRPPRRHRFVGVPAAPRPPQAKGRPPPPPPAGSRPYDAPAAPSAAPGDPAGRRLAADPRPTSSPSSQPSARRWRSSSCSASAAARCTSPTGRAPAPLGRPRSAPRPPGASPTAPISCPAGYRWRTDG
ncbi:MAG: phage protease [Alkalilacustris sp.]